MRCQLVLDHALTALAATPSDDLQAVIAAETPTLEGLCAALDAFRVPMPDGVVGHVCGWRDHAAAPTAQSMPQDLPTKIRAAI